MDLFWSILHIMHRFCNITLFLYTVTEAIYQELTGEATSTHYQPNLASSYASVF